MMIHRGTNDYMNYADKYSINFHSLYLRLISPNFDNYHRIMLSSTPLESETNENFFPETGRPRYRHSPSRCAISYTKKLNIVSRWQRFPKTVDSTTSLKSKHYRSKARLHQTWRRKTCHRLTTTIQEPNHSELWSHEASAGCPARLHVRGPSRAERRLL